VKVLAPLMINAQLDLTRWIIIGKHPARPAMIVFDPLSIHSIRPMDINILWDLFNHNGMHCNGNPLLLND